MKAAPFPMGNAHYGLGDPRGVFKDFGKAIEPDPKLADAYLNRGKAYCNIGDSVHGLEDLNKAASHNTKGPKK